MGNNLHTIFYVVDHICKVKCQFINEESKLFWMIFSCLLHMRMGNTLHTIFDVIDPIWKGNCQFINESV
jgi:hypothetical protein